jgi:hypothetical protein
VSAYRRLDVDVLQALVVQNGISLPQLPIANEGARKSHKPASVQNAEDVAAGPIFQPSVRLPPVKLSADLL